MKLILKKTIFTLCGIFLGLVVLELLLAYPVYYFAWGNGHVFYSRPHSHAIFVEHPKLSYVTSPNLIIKRPKPPGMPTAPRFSMAYDVQTDQNGFRYNKSLPHKKPRDETRIFAFGGSTTQGLGVPNKWTYPQQLEDMINNPDIKVVNAGVGGYRSVHFKILYEEIIQSFEPDIITLYSGWNDFEGYLYDFWAPKNPHGHTMYAQMQIDKIPFNDLFLVYATGRLYFHFKNMSQTEAADILPKTLRGYDEAANDPLWQEEYKTNLQEFITAVKTDGVIPVLIIFPSPEFTNASPEVKSYAEIDLNLVGRWDSFIVALKNIRKILRDLAKENDIPLIDVNKEFEKYNENYKDKFLFFVDRAHLSEEGNKLVAQAMLGPILNIVKESKK